MEEGWDPFVAVNEWMDGINKQMKEMSDRINEQYKAYKKWSDEPMKYLTHWWEPKFAWWPTRIYNPPPNHDDILWVSNERAMLKLIWFKFYLRRKYMTNGLETGWRNIRYEGPNGLGSIIRGQLNRLRNSWAKHQTG